MQLVKQSYYFYINFFQVFSLQFATEFTTQCIIGTEKKLWGYQLMCEASAKRGECILPPFRQCWNGKAFSDVGEP